jgi:small subunit ribosomal protein S7
MDLIVNEKKHKADSKYQSPVVSKFINMIMERGKKTIARGHIYKMLSILEEKTQNDGLFVLETALKNVGPTLEVKSKRIGGANYQVPVIVPDQRRLTLAMRWIITFARAKKGRSINEKLADEIIAAFKGEGSAVKKRIDVQKMAEANKAFAHFGK